MMDNQMAAATRSIQKLEWDLRECERRYRELQELSGQAVVRANIMRGNGELKAAQLAERVDELEQAVARYFAVGDEDGLREVLGERFDGLVRAATTEA